ncbi:MAG: hypothetical protein EHM33_03070 [Chloroflexi bacterium]|nr:MAG: hypothetical protein EHM33_03070 [Chloroflexota bacterium]
MNNSPNTTPRGPSSTLSRNGNRLSQRGMFSILMLFASIGALGFALLGGAKLILDIFSIGLVNSLDGLGTKALVVGLAYAVGWLTAMVAIRVYGNLVLPFVINFLIWGCLIGVCALYVLILQRLYDQAYDLPHYLAYLMIVAAGLAAMVGLHLIIEDHDLRPFSIPLLIISMIQLGLIVFRYVFTTTANPGFLWKDLLFFLMMGLVAFLMLAHIGLLKPLRIQLANYFDRNSKVIRTDK